jgi:D-alanyl-D-alanine carboxypeptidase (penicillin-binding protein 5/6)
LQEDLYLTVPRGQFVAVKGALTLTPHLMAPIPKSSSVGDLQVVLGEQVIARRPLHPLADVPRGGLWTRMVDTMRLWFQ